MPVCFDHLLVAATDKRRSAEFFASIFGLSAPEESGFFVAAKLSDGVTINFAEPGVDFPGQHYAFLVDDDGFDALVKHLQYQKIPYWADPGMSKPGTINTNHGGRECTLMTPMATIWRRSLVATRAETHDTNRVAWE